MKIFACSDIHGFYNEFKQALENAGFEDNNPNHLLIICGDFWDRGYNPYKITEYLNSIDNKILVRGNHEQLMEYLIKRGYPMNHDYHNGTAETAAIIQEELAMVEDKVVSVMNYKYIEPFVKNFYDQMVNYYETQNYIFVHCWIPYKTKEEYVDNEEISKFDRKQLKNIYRKDWRRASQEKWDTAMWGNPFLLEQEGLNQTGKVIVHGHWHNSYHFANTENLPEFGEGSKFEIARHGNCIGLDTCTAYTNKVNVLVVEDDLIIK